MEKFTNKPKGIKKFLIRLHFTIILLMSTTFAHAQQSNQKMIVAGFYPYTKDYILKPESIQLNNLTHLIYAFAGPRADGSISTETGSYHNKPLVDRVHAAGKKFIIMMGGGLQSGGFHEMAKSASTRTIFINTLKDWIRTYGYDGVNIDWEYPGANDKNEDRQNLTLLVQEMRTGFNALEAELGKKLEISMDIHSSIYYAQWVDFAALKNNMDWFGLMSYDYAGDWPYSIHAAHNAPLFCGPDSICSRYLSVDTGVKNVRDSLGIPANKIVMGLAFYGREFYNSALYQTPKEGGGALAYYDIQPLIGNGYTRIWDNQSKVPYLKKNSGSGIISYDDEESLKLKADYIKQNQLAGAMIWEITQDVDKVTKQQPLMATVGTNLVGTVVDPTGIPTVSITSPVNNFVFTPGGNVTVSADAKVEAGFTIQKVDFYRNNTLVGTDNSAPYSFTITNIPGGKHTLKAIATSSSGKTGESAVVSITDGVVPAYTEMWDDFNYSTSSDTELGGINKWYVVNGVDGPPSGAVYAKEGITFYADPQNSANKIMGVSTVASNDPTKNRHARIETAIMPYRNGTFAARVYFDDTPAQYGDANVETFYTINSYATCNNADLYSEVDFEYLPWDAWHWERKTTMYYTSWETCEIRDHVKSVQSFAGWHDLVYTAAEGQPVKWYIDGQLMGTMDKHTPDSDVNISFANWIYQNTTGSSTTTRTTTMQVDWVYHAKDVVITPTDVLQKVASLRQNKVIRKNLQGDQVVDGNLNPVPTVTITSPAANATFTAPATITITATASDQNSTVSKVEFFNGGIKLGEDLTSPYSFTWNAVTAGTYTITARATDIQGAVGSSTAVTVSVVPTCSNPPTVAFTAPANGSHYAPPASIAFAVNATAGCADRTITKVDFYNGNTLLGSDNTAPYTFTWSAVAAGNYSITAKATDSKGAIGTSAVLTVTVGNRLPVISITSPASNSNFAPPAIIVINATASDADGSIAKVEFFNGAIKLGEDLTAPYSFTWSNVGIGNYAITARATDNQGATQTSASVAVSVSTVTPSKLEAVYKTIVEWGSGFQGEVRVYNRGTLAVSNWTVQLDCPHNLTPIWDATIVSRVGNRYTISSANTTANIPAGGSIAFGFLGIIDSGRPFTPPIVVSAKSGVNARIAESQKGRARILVYPNPSSGFVNLEFELQVASDAELCVYDNSGIMVERKIYKNLPTGVNKIGWDGSRSGTGIYFYKLKLKDKVITNTFLLTK